MVSLLTIDLQAAAELVLVLGVSGVVLFGWYRYRQREKVLFEELESEKERLSRLTCEVPGMLYEFRRTADGRMWVPFSNQWMERLFGIELEEVRRDAMPLLQRVLEADQERVFESIRISYERVEDWRCEFRVRDAMDRVRWLFGNASIQKDGKGTASWFGFVTDITPQKEIEQELVDAREAAERASRAKTEFLSMMSHEIRTPMNGILPILDMLRDDLDKPEHRELVKVARQSGDLLLKLINDILDYNRIAAGRIDLEQRPLRPVLVAEEAAASQRPLATDKGIAVVVEDKRGGDRRLYGDDFRIKQILMNLLNNAIKFSDGGTVGVDVRVEGPQDGKSPVLRLAVTDEGSGMDPELVQSVLEPFRQADSSTSRRYGGTGLGLAICRGLVEAMDGTIDVQSESGVGTRVEVALPLNACEEQPCLAEASDSSPERRVPLSAQKPAGDDGFRVLMVEDEPVNVVVQRRMLEGFAIDPEVAVSGEEALRMLRERRYDLVFMDIRLPGMSGLEVMRAVEGQHRPYFIAMTAHALQRHREDCYAAGADDFVTKPVAAEELEAALGRFRAGRQPG